MKTSYFANPRAAQDPNAVSIARWPPQWWGPRRRYLALAPPEELLKYAKAGMPWPEYATEYQREVLTRLDPSAVYAELGPEAILLCWEAPGKDCHRRLVAQWLQQALETEIGEL